MVGCYDIRMYDTLVLNANLATMRAGGAPYGAVRDGAIGIAGGRIAWVGPRAELQGAPEALATEVLDAERAWITPGLVDCHTHLVYAGNRANEFEMRLNGASYEDIARAGGGIVSTVRSTRDASDNELATSASARLGRLLAEGVTTIEIKSGYGLDLDTELRMLRIARLLGETAPVTVKKTFLGAHAVPGEYKGRADEYIDFVANEVLPEAARAGLVDAVDAFCETIAFTPAQTMRVFDAAKALGLPVKLHADQRSDYGGAALAARYGALSADHIEYSSEAGIAAMAAAGTVGVLLPGAYYFLRENHLPPIDAMRRHGLAIALATDSNPGSSPLVSILLALNLACTLFRLTPEEALAGVTRNGAKALGMGGTHGTIEAGKAADLVFWRVESPGELAYAMGANPCARVLKSQQ
ncbi:MAG: imidazolonepropionase [Proteobacteria bacterium]|nr:imidazolonepropionase [Pseudomonadota bacterium]